MSSALEKLIEDDLVSVAIYDALSMRESKQTRSGYTNICCPVCVRRGTSQDHKFRCGIRFSDSIGVNCFNCFFKGRFRVGDRLSNPMRDFLVELGIPPRDVQKLAMWADMVRSMMQSRPDLHVERTLYIPKFYETDLPPKARSLQDWATDCHDDPDFLATVDYLLSRGTTAANATTYYWSPSMKQRLIIPCYHNDMLVGWTARGINDEVDPRYLKELPSNYLFNTKFLTIPERKYVFIVEGVFDALVIEGIAALGGSLNEAQISWINHSNKQPVVIPDRDKSGRHLIEIAIRQGWPVATPCYPGNRWWDEDIKDCADATKRYDKLYVVQSIVANLTYNKTQIYERTRLPKTYHETVTSV